MTECDIFFYEVVELNTKRDNISESFNPLATDNNI